jgi:hypothetical protein
MIFTILRLLGCCVQQQQKNKKARRAAGTGGANAYHTYTPPQI